MCKISLYEGITEHFLVFTENSNNIEFCNVEKTITLRIFYGNKSIENLSIPNRYGYKYKRSTKVNSAWKVMLAKSKSLFSFVGWVAAVYFKMY